MKAFLKKSNTVLIAVYALIVALTAWIVLDFWVFPKSLEEISSSKQGYPSDATKNPGRPRPTAIPQNGDSDGKEKPFITDYSYVSGDLSIQIEKVREYDTDIYVVDVRLSSPNQLRCFFARDKAGRNILERTSSQASRNGAILAINGDNFGAREGGFVIRNGKIYRTTPGSNSGDDLIVFGDGSMEIMEETAMDPIRILEEGAMHVFSFGPALVNNGGISVEEDTEVQVAQVSNPRTAIGWLEDLHYVLVVSDGRTEENRGLKLWELAEFMQNLGVKVGYNLDGGGSSTLWFRGRLINQPTTYGNIEERGVSDIVAILD